MKTLAQILMGYVEEKKRAGQRVIFVSGAQGAGKTTSVKILADHYPDIAVLSLDDFYLPQTDRLKLAERVSPMFATRGPPGTHDVCLLHDTIGDLMKSGKDDKIGVPVFDKLRDDRCEPSEWRSLPGSPSMIIVEGWLMGVNPKVVDDSDFALNAVEAMDEDGAWRAYQEQQLLGDYASLWDIGESYFHIVAPDFNAVKTWRTQQEETTMGLPQGSLSNERREWVKNFIMYYERLTQRMLDGHCRDGLRVPINILRTPVDV